VDINTQVQQGQVVLPIRANDPPEVVIAYTVWNRMIENRSLDVKRACEETAVPRWQFYQALNNELVQGEIGHMLAVMRTVEARFLQENWFDMLSYQMRIATGDEGTPRDAVAAARFLDGIRQGVEGKMDGGHKKEAGKHPARALLESARGSVTTLRRTTVTEEIEVTPPGDQ